MVTVPCTIQVGQSIMYRGGRTEYHVPWRMVTVSCTVEVGQSIMYHGGRTEYHVPWR